MSQDNRITAIFKVHTVKNEAKTKKEGRPIYDDMEVVECRFAADRERVLVAPAHSFCGWYTNADGGQEQLTYAMRFNEQYKRFKENRQQVVSGTPLEELPFLTQSKRLELKALNVHTAETLASLDGPNLKTIGMGGRELKNQAQAYLDNASGSAAITKIAAENEGLKEQLRLLQEQVASIKSAPKESPASDFDDWDDESIKQYIDEATGARPRGNPSHETLVRMADEIVAEQKKDSEAA